MALIKGRIIAISKSLFFAGFDVELLFEGVEFSLIESFIVGGGVLESFLFFPLSLYFTFQNASLASRISSKAADRIAENCEEFIGTT